MWLACWFGYRQLVGLYYVGKGPAFKGQVPNREKLHAHVYIRMYVCGYVHPLFSPALISPCSPPTKTVLDGSRRGDGHLMELLSERAHGITCTCNMQTCGRNRHSHPVRVASFNSQLQLEQLSAFAEPISLFGERRKALKRRN